MPAWRVPWTVDGSSESRRSEQWAGKINPDADGPEVKTGTNRSRRLGDEFSAVTVGGFL